MGEDKRLTCELTPWYNLYRWREAFFYIFFITVLVLYPGVFWFFDFADGREKCTLHSGTVYCTSTIFPFLIPVSFGVQLLAHGSCLDDISDCV